MTTAHTLAQRPASRLLLLFAALVATSACSETNTRTDDAGTRSDTAPSVDAPYSTDAPAPIDTGVFTDAPRRDGGGVASCTADAASEGVCASTCDGPPTWHWNGTTCFPITCGACVGPDCDLGVNDPASCTAAHATCEASLCGSTGGEWLWWAEECGHYSCGVAPPATCESGFAVCDCPGGRFTPGVGCTDDITCVPTTLTRQELCTTSGGTWENVCCDSVCGVPCAAECLAPACTCGPMEIFDPARGCREATDCYDPAAGEVCGSESRCASGTICCQTCGGAGCFGPATCRAPVCDDEPLIDTCGNDSRVP